MIVRLRRVSFEWYEPDMGEHDYYNASGLSAYLLMLAREGFLYEVDNYDATTVLADADVELPEVVSNAYYNFVEHRDEGTKVYDYEGTQYIFDAVRDIG